MKVNISIILVSILMSFQLVGQAPIVYINFVSHNEPGDGLQNLSNFNSMTPKVSQLATIIDSKGASWNLQTCDGYAKGALDFEGASSNIFRTLSLPPYGDNIEIDPRNKQTLYPTIADLYHILDSLGGNPTTTLGGFLYSPSPNWFQYQNTITAINFPSVTWKCNLMWGAGSPNHTNDYNDYGIWKPDSTTSATFPNHNSNRDIWFVGNGCQPIYALDSTENIVDILTPLKGFIDSLQALQLPQNKFYCYSITINQSHFGPTLFSKVSAICDTINAWGTDKIRWATLTQKLDTFQTWQMNTSLQYSQWKCGQTVAELNDIENMNFSVFPNPSKGNFEINFEDNQEHALTIYSLMGEEIINTVIRKNGITDLSLFPSGFYLGVLDNDKAFKLVKQ